MRADTLPVPGARLYYEVRGRGPVLLLLPGSGGDAGVFDPIADTLAEHFTVVAADPRGYSRSTLDRPEPVDQQVAVFVDDARRLLEHLTPAGETAAVFGTSGGAVVALDLLAAHPGRIRRVIAHEPPLFAILSDAAEHRAMIEEVYRLLHTDGPGAAGARFLAAIGGSTAPLPDPADLPPRAVAMWARLTANGPLMMEHELRQITGHLPDLTALHRHADRLALGVGRNSRGHLPSRPAALLAEQLGRPLLEFPGGHTGLREDPAEFARVLLAALGAESAAPDASRQAARRAAVLDS